MSSPGFSIELRLAVVKFYLSGGDSVRGIASRFGVGRTAVRRWVASYQKHGIDGLTWKEGLYSPEFRLTVVKAVINDKLSLRDTVARFNLSSEGTVHQWIKVYLQSGEEIFLKRKRGRSKKLDETEKEPIITPDKVDNRNENISEKEMLAELRYLRAEVAYLKKLKALVQDGKNR